MTDSLNMAPGWNPVSEKHLTGLQKPIYNRSGGSSQSLHTPLVYQRLMLSEQFDQIFEVAMESSSQHEQDTKALQQVALATEPETNFPRKISCSSTIEAAVVISLAPNTLLLGTH